jgi:hypothetical protein
MSGFLDTLQAEARRQARAAMSPRDLIAEGLREAGRPPEIIPPPAAMSPAAPPPRPRAEDLPRPAPPPSRAAARPDGTWGRWSREP